MKFLLKFFLIGVILPILLTVTIFTVKPSLLSEAGKIVLENVLSSKNLRLEASQVHFLWGKIEINDANLYQEKDNVISIKKAVVDYDIAKSIKKFGIYFDVSILDFKMEDINLNFSGSFVLKRSRTTIDNLKIDFGDKSYLALSMDYRTFMGVPYILKSEGNVENFPLMIHKAFWHIAPNNGIVEFLREFILSGSVTGEWKLNLDKSFFASKVLNPEDLSGNLKLKNVDFKYDEVFPVIKNLNSDVTLVGTNIDFAIREGYSGKILISNSVVVIDWSRGEDTEVVAKIKGKGPAVELASFIPADDLAGMKKYDIDLYQIKGTTDLDVSLIIPLKPGTINKYDVTANILSVTFSAFDDVVSLSSPKLVGKFDGDVVKIEGDGKLNNLPSAIFYQMNLSDDKDKDFDHLFSAKIKFTPVDGSKHDVISAISGGSVIDLQYKLKEGGAELAANSNLTNVEFMINKLGVHKPKGSFATLAVSGRSSTSPMPEKININLSGNNGLKIIGDFEIFSAGKRLTFSQIRYKDTDLEANILYGVDSVKANIVGNSLDLSEADMMRFLDKEADARATDVVVHVNKVKMKNDILMDDFSMNIRCDKVRCYEGAMDSKIGTRSVKMLLSAEGDEEKWEFSTTNAGALLKAVGMYNKMLAGNMILTVNSSRKEIKAGEQVSIMKGRFNLNKFVISDINFLAKLVSFVSIQGLIDSFNNKNRVNFIKMDGGFGYKDGVVKIENGQCQGQMFDFSIAGSINTNSRIYKLKGSVVPSLYGANALIRKIPLVGKILSAPYFLKDSY